MYLNYFHMTKEPFNVTPDPEFLFLSPSHKEALAAVIYGIQQKKGFIAIIGEVGTGKTTVLRSYLDSVDRNRMTPIYLFNANITFAGLLKTMLRSLGLDCASDVPFDMVTRLHEYLISEYSKGRTVVLIIDEAQNMPVETLENLRMLSNLETTRDKLIQVVFSGQPEFEELLSRKELRQLKQRISVKATILPLNGVESMSYIRHRLAKAGEGEESIFTGSALKLIVRQSQGIPRVINMLCDNSLITAYGQNRKSVSERVVKEIIADSNGQQRSAFRRSYAVAGALVGVVFAVGIFAAVHPQRFQLVVPAVRPAPAAATAVEVVPPAPAIKVDSAAAAGQPVTVSRIVRKGDTVAKMMVDIYGYADKKDFELVKKNNPGITNVNRIVEGDRIIFPATNR